jgi:hypothetical protein
MFFDDDLPVWGFVGKIEHTRPHGIKDGLQGEQVIYLFTHFHFDIAYNQDQVRCVWCRMGGGGCVRSMADGSGWRSAGDSSLGVAAPANCLRHKPACTNGLHQTDSTDPPPQVIELNVSTVSVDPNKTVDITHDDSKAVRFSYSVKWAPTTVPFDERMDRYSRYSFLPQHLEVGG